MTSTESGIVQNLLNSTLFNQFLASNFPAISSSNNFYRLIQILPSKDADQTISVTSADELSVSQSTNIFNSTHLRNFSKNENPVFDFKRCVVYTFKTISQLNYSGLKNYSDTVNYCSTQYANAQGLGIYFKDDQQVASLLKLLKSGEMFFFPFWFVFFEGGTAISMCHVLGYVHSDL